MSVREVGSYIGYNRVTSTSQDSASGIWSLAAAERRMRAAAWPQTIPFAPDDLSGLQLWLDASDANTLYDATSGGSLVAADGGVARWEDKSGNARHATQSTSADRPLRKTLVQGGKDVLRFDGTSDYMTVPSSTAALKFLHDGDSTVFLVLKAGTSANPGHGRYSLISNLRDGGSTEVGIEINHRDSDPSTENDHVDVFVGKGLGGNYPIYSPNNNFFPSGSVGVISAVLKPDDATSGNRVSLRRNGGSASTPNNPLGANQTVSTADAGADLNIARRPGLSYPADGFLNGDYCEIIIYDSALSDTDREAVENYLMTKWGIAPAPVPQTIPGLQLWLDASSADTLFDATSGGSLVAADGSVARWEDKSGNGRHATQGTSANRPARKTAIQGGKDVLRFDGSNDSLSIPSSTATFKFLHSADSTVFIVFSRPTNGTYAFLLGNYDSSTSKFGAHYRTDNGSATNDRLTHQIAGGVTGSLVVNHQTANGFVPSGFSVASFVSKPGDGTAANRSSMRLNGGTAVTDNASTVAVSTANADQNLHIATDMFAGGAQFSACDIAEVIIYDSALSDADREAVENYLLAKWAAAWPTPVEVEYLVIAGGGSGGVSHYNANATSGGGGAGGYRTNFNGETSGGGAASESSFSSSPGTTYTVTVGAGGSGSATVSVNGTSGGSSAFGSISCTGGGYGSSGESNTNGGSGGSGGGAAYRYGTKSGGTGTASEGYDGGSTSSNINVGGGGGGAGGAGSQQNAGGSPSIGGSGLASGITGSSITRATGGRGSFDGSGPDGASNTGSGGAGYGTALSPNRGGNGGSGVVIIRAPQAAASTTGSPTVTTDGGDTIYTFTGSGSITF